jgi:hypothetical protein
LQQNLRFEELFHGVPQVVHLCFIVGHHLPGSVRVRVKLQPHSGCSSVMTRDTRSQDAVQQLQSTQQLIQQER